MYRVVRTYPSRWVIAENLTKEEAKDKASMLNLGSDSESFTFERM